MPAAAASGAVVKAHTKRTRTLRMASLAIEGDSRGGLPGAGLLDEASDEDEAEKGQREVADAGGDEPTTALAACPRLGSRRR